MKSTDCTKTPGRMYWQVLVGRALHRAAEQVGEHQQEEDRRDRRVEQLLRDVLDLEHAAPGERAAGGEGARRRRALARDERGLQRLLAQRRDGLVGDGRSRRRLPGEGEEDLVQRRLAEREGRDGDARRATSSASASAARSASGARARARPGRSPATAPSRRSSAASRCSGSASAHVQRAAADRRLELARRPLGDHVAAVDDGDPRRELVGLVEVLRAQQDGRPLGDERADDLPHLVARARVQARRRLVEEQQLRRDDDARRDVEAPAHAARVVLDEPARGRLEAEAGQQLVGALARARVCRSPAGG